MVFLDTYMAIVGAIDSRLVRKGGKVKHDNISIEILDSMDEEIVLDG